MHQLRPTGKAQDVSHSCLWRPERRRESVCRDLLARPRTIRPHRSFPIRPRDGSEWVSCQFSVCLGKYIGGITEFDCAVIHFTTTLPNFLAPCWRNIGSRTRVKTLNKSFRHECSCLRRGPVPQIQSCLLSYSCDNTTQFPCDSQFCDSNAADHARL